MTKQQIINYLLTTPYNTNPNIVGAMIDQYGGGESGDPVTLTIQNGASVPFADEIYAWSWVGEDGTIHHDSKNGFTGAITNIKRGTMVSIFCDRDMTNSFNIPAETNGAMFTMKDVSEKVIGWGLSIYMDDNRTISITV